LVAASEREKRCGDGEIEKAERNVPEVPKGGHTLLAHDGEFCTALRPRGR